MRQAPNPEKIGEAERLRLHLLACSEAFEDGDFRKSDEAVDEVVEFLDSVSESSSPQDSEEVLLEIQRFLSSDSSNQMVVDALCLAVPRLVVKLASVSDTCREITQSVIECIVLKCSPRDMLPVLCEALDSTLKVSTTLLHFVLLLNWLSNVLACNKRQHIQQVKVSLPIVVNVLDVVLSESDNSRKGSVATLIHAAVGVATSIQSICGKLVGKAKEELRAILGLYVLQIMAIISKSDIAENVSDCSPFIMHLSCFLSWCGLSYISLITGSGVAAITNVIHKEDNDDFLCSFSMASNGASLAVIWGYITREVAESAGENINIVLDNLRITWNNRWQAIDMLRHVLSVDYSWMIKDHIVDLLLSIVNESKCGEYDDKLENDSSTFIRMYSCLKAIEKVVIYAPDASLRKKAFVAMKKVFFDVQPSQQFDLLKSLIENSISPSMSALLIDIVKEKIICCNNQSISLNNEIRDLDIASRSIQPEWCSNALELVDFILKPPMGGPPCLPEQTEPVLSALNLYRFILLTESTGKTNYSGALSENNLKKAYTHWLLPLRMLVSKIEAESNDVIDAFARFCSLNPVQLVLYRCIELVEEIQKHSK